MSYIGLISRKLVTRSCSNQPALLQARMELFFLSVSLQLYTQLSCCITVSPESKKKNHSKIVNIFLSNSYNIKFCFRCPKEPSRWNGSFEYPQHVFWFRNKKIIIFWYTFWSEDLIMLLTNIVYCLLQAHRNLSQLPNFAFSVALALFHMESIDKADHMVSCSCFSDQ